ncbi:hyaluronan synthase 3 [Alternaria alternata]|nr:hyaluronan synthase 3 [Alternaria alternata]
MKILTTHWLRMNFTRLCSYCTSFQPSKTSELGDERKHSFSEPKIQILVTRSGKIYNFIGCLVAAALYCYTTLYWSDYLYTFDTIITVYLAEQCGWDNERVRRSSQKEKGEKVDVYPQLSVAEKGEYYTHSERSSKLELGCIAAIVGYREDPIIFTKALESYTDAEGCRFVLTCIDGNEAEDQVMVDVFRKVYPSSSAVIDLPIPLVDIALQMECDAETWRQDIVLIEKCIAHAKQTLLDHEIHLAGPNAITHLCVTQPHMHKKGIMFTSFIVCFALSELLDIEYVWTSDSDSMVYKDTIMRTIQTIHGDDKCAGASTALNIHNRKDNLVTTLGNTIYLNDLHLSRCFSSAVGANDCQSGPCAAFRIEAIKPKLLAWYKQTIFGHWMIVNEDRHMTTRLLLQGYRVRYISHAVTATETPVTLRRWLLQQVRWARAVHIESYAHPTMYLNQPPLFFYAALRREITSFVIFTTMVSYFFVGVSPFMRFIPRDYVVKFLLTAVYLKARNPINPTWGEWVWSVPAALFYMIPLPAIQAWSFVTMLANEWDGQN